MSIFQTNRNDRAVDAARLGMTEAAYVLTRSRNQIISTDPYFATLILSLVITEDVTIDTMCTNGVQIKYNPTFVNSLTLDECKGVLAHEALHCALLHHLRREGRDPERWNIACDYVVNDALVKSNYVLPNDALIDPQFSSMSAEDVYTRIPKSDQQKGSQGANTGTSGPQSQAWGQVEDYDPHNSAQTGDKPTTSEIEKAATDWNIINQQAKKAAKSMGSGINQALDRLINKAHNPKVSWREVISRFLEETSRNNYTWQRPNPRYIQSGIVMPSLLSKSYGQVLIAVDTSGSVTDDEVSKMVSEVISILEIYEDDKGNSKLPVLYCDSEIRNFEWLEIYDSPNPKGGGGTNYRPVFEWITEKGFDEGINPKAVIYLTDGECNRFPSTEPDVPVVWCLTQDNDSFTPPFGEVTSFSNN